MGDRDRDQSATSKRPSADRSIPRGTDEHAPDEADAVVQPADESSAKRESQRKSERPSD
jgi:hypothetical protein